MITAERKTEIDNLVNFLMGGPAKFNFQMFRELYGIEAVQTSCILSDGLIINVNGKLRIAIRLGCGVNLNLSHELGHIVLGHVENKYKSCDNVATLEDEADYFQEALAEKTKNSNWLDGFYFNKVDNIWS